VSVREQVDGFVLRDRRLEAIRVALEAFRVLEEGAQAPRAGLHDCQRVVTARYQALADRVVRQPEPPRDVETLAARIRGLPDNWPRSRPYGTETRTAGSWCWSLLWTSLRARSSWR
jgi:hypothetical protein